MIAKFRRAFAPVFEKLRVLIADDHVAIVEGLAAMIGRQRDMTVVGVSGNGDEAVELWERHRPDVALFDLRMPGLDGVEATARICSRHAGARVIVLTTFDTDYAIARAIKAGARGFLLKETPGETLLDAIRRVHRGETCLPPAVVANLVAGASRQTTAREQTVLELLARGRSKKEIAADSHLSETTVKSHLRSIYHKLNVRSRTEALAAASRRGLIRL